MLSTIGRAVTAEMRHRLAHLVDVLLPSAEGQLPLFRDKSLSHVQTLAREARGYRGRESGPLRVLAEDILAALAGITPADLRTGRAVRARVAAALVPLRDRAHAMIRTRRGGAAETATEGGPETAAANNEPQAEVTPQ